jgi:pyrroline-5-carboxylate reductase
MQVVLVGCGRMGGALLRGWLKAGLTPVAVLDPHAEAQPGVIVLANPQAVADLSGPLCVVMAVKPAKTAPMLEALAPHLGADSLVLSVAAGVTLAQMRAATGEGPALVRTMPNTPAGIGKGAVGAVAAAELSETHAAMTKRLLEAAGEVFWLDHEDLIDAVIGVSGSGPAYFYRFTEMLAQAGEKLGLTPDMAKRLAELTFTGSAAWLEASGKSPDELRVEVTSPNGTTAAALAVFDKDDRLGVLLNDATQACVARAQEMSRG